MAYQSKPLLNQAVGTYFFPAGATSPVPAQGEQRIPFKMPEPWHVWQSRVGALVWVDME
jgi:hypothetical protein